MLSCVFVTFFSLLLGSPAEIFQPVIKPVSCSASSVYNANRKCENVYDGDKYLTGKSTTYVTTYIIFTG